LYVDISFIRDNVTHNLHNVGYIFFLPSVLRLIAEEMTRVLRETTDLNDAHVIHDMFVATDTNGDGRITFVEFVKMMQE
uniref:EF-hand domain-containing protein n=1 Tax=Angiostrongylus cantonensis TaxID=6313 RepID=A0A0K0D8N0_ANGCA